MVLLLVRAVAVLVVLYNSLFELRGFHVLVMLLKFHKINEQYLLAW